MLNERCSLGLTLRLSILSRAVFCLSPPKPTIRSHVDVGCVSAFLGTVFSVGLDLHPLTPPLYLEIYLHNLMVFC